MARRIATASYDKLIKLWDVESGKEIRTLKDHIDAVYALAFTPDGKRLVSASADRGVKIWDVASGERLYTLSEPTDGLNTLAIDPAGKRVAAGGPRPHYSRVVAGREERHVAEFADRARGCHPAIGLVAGWQVSGFVVRG